MYEKNPITQTRRQKTIPTTPLSDILSSMALVKTSPAIKSIRGRFGGVYFKSGPDGQHIQAMPRVWKYTRSPSQQGAWGPASPFHSTGISGFSGAAALWGLALLAFGVSLWLAFAMIHYFSRAGKEPKYITGYNWYIYYALAFPECERPPFWKPPHSPRELPNFIASYKGLWTYHHAPDDWPDESPSDYYWQGVPWNGKPSYHNDPFTWFLWWKPPLWVLSPGLDYEPEGRTWYSMTGDIMSPYKNPVTHNSTSVYWGRAEERLLPH